MEDADLIANYEKEATGFVRALDRSSLGRMAVPENLLITALTFDLISDRQNTELFKSDFDAKNNVDPLILSLARAVSTMNFRYAREVLASGFKPSAVWGELHFWQGYKLADGDVNANRCHLIANSDPAFHDFYVVGIWDKEAIEVFIAAGIDPELAKVVV